MNASAGREGFSPGEEENAGIAALCRGFLTKAGGKKSVLPE